MKREKKNGTSIRDDLRKFDLSINLLAMIRRSINVYIIQFNIENLLINQIIRIGPICRSSYPRIPQMKEVQNIAKNTMTRKQTSYIKGT